MPKRQRDEHGHARAAAWGSAGAHRPGADPAAIANGQPASFGARAPVGGIIPFAIDTEAADVLIGAYCKAQGWPRYRPPTRSASAPYSDAATSHGSASSFPAPTLVATSTVTPSTMCVTTDAASPHPPSHSVAPAPSLAPSLSYREPGTTCAVPYTSFRPASHTAVSPHTAVPAHTAVSPDLVRASTGVASPHGAVVALHGGQLEAEARPTTTMADAMRAHAFTPLGGPPPTDPHGATAPAWTPPPPSSSTVGLGQPTGPTVVQSVGPSVPAESRAEKSSHVASTR